MCQGLITTGMRTLGGMCGAFLQMHVCVHLYVESAFVWVIGAGETGQEAGSRGGDRTVSAREAQFHLRPRDWRATNPTSSTTKQTCQHSSGNHWHTHTHTSAEAENWCVACFLPVSSCTSAFHYPIKYKFQGRVKWVQRLTEAPLVLHLQYKFFLMSVFPFVCHTPARVWVFSVHACVWICSSTCLCLVSFSI